MKKRLTDEMSVVAKCIFGLGCEDLTCAVCVERQALQSELDKGITPERVCSECHNLYELDDKNPLGDILFEEGAGVYFVCDSCFVLESESDTFYCQHCARDVDYCECLYCEECGQNVNECCGCEDG